MNRHPFAARFRLLRWNDTYALADQDVANGTEPSLLPWIGSHVMLRVANFFPKDPATPKSAVEVFITGICEETVKGGDFFIEVVSSSIHIFPSKHTLQDLRLFITRPF